MNDNFSIKKCSQHCFHLRFFVLTFSAFRFFGLNQVVGWRFVSGSYMKRQHSSPVIIPFKTFLSSSVTWTNSTDDAGR
jgi:hypothetical protein